jgi:hypothetical protein
MSVDTRFGARKSKDLSSKHFACSAAHKQYIVTKKFYDLLACRIKDIGARSNQSCWAPTPLELTFDLQQKGLPSQ